MSYLHENMKKEAKILLHKVPSMVRSGRDVSTYRAICLCGRKHARVADLVCDKLLQFRYV